MFFFFLGFAFTFPKNIQASPLPHDSDFQTIFNISEDSCTVELNTQTTEYITDGMCTSNKFEVTISNVKEVSIQAGDNVPVYVLFNEIHANCETIILNGPIIAHFTTTPNQRITLQMKIDFGIKAPFLYLPNTNNYQIFLDCSFDKQQVGTIYQAIGFSVYENSGRGSLDITNNADGQYDIKIDSQDGDCSDLSFLNEGENSFSTVMKAFPYAAKGNELYDSETEKFKSIRYISSTKEAEKDPAAPSIDPGRQQEDHESGMTTGQIVGLGVGLILGVVIIIVVVLIILRKRKMAEASGGEVNDGFNVY